MMCISFRTTGTGSDCHFYRVPVGTVERQVLSKRDCHVLCEVRVKAEKQISIYCVLHQVNFVTGEINGYFALNNKET